MSVLTGDRTTEYRWDLLDLSDALVGTLDQAEGARLEWSVAREIRSTGSLEWAGSSIPDWTQVRLQPWVTITDPLGATLTWPLGVYIPTTPSVTWSPTCATAQVDLYDKLQLLVDAKVTAPYALPQGSVITDAVRALIAGTGETRMVITDSASTLRSSMIWEPGVTVLRIVNDLLATANYFSVWVDGQGYFRADPYVAPQSRGIAWSFADDESSIYAPGWAHDRDAFGVPNVVTLISRSDADTPALTATARNATVGDPLSVPSRGREVIVVETDVEAASQDVLDGLAARRLADLSRVSSSVQIQHAPIPLLLNDAVRFASTTAGLDVLGVVQSMTLDCAPGALMTSHLQEVQ